MILDKNWVHTSVALTVMGAIRLGLWLFAAGEKNLAEHSWVAEADDQKRQHIHLETVEDRVVQVVRGWHMAKQRRGHAVGKPRETGVLRLFEQKHLQLAPF